MTDATLPETVEAALAPETFDVLEFVSGQGTPEDTVTVYAADKAARRLAKLVAIEAESEARGAAEGFGIADELEWADPDEIAALRKEIEATALTFELTGLAPAAKKALRNSLVAKHGFSEKKPLEEQEAYFIELTHTLIAKSIKGVTRADGAKGASEWTPEMVAGLQGNLNESEWARLDQAVVSINYDTDSYDIAASADFLSKR